MGWGRILKVMDDVSCRPNSRLLDLKDVRNKVIGVVFPHVTVPLTNVYFRPVLEGILEAATGRKMATILFTGLTREESETSAERLCNGVCDGFVLVAPRHKSRLVKDLSRSRVPVVVVGAHPLDADVPTVDADNRAGGRMATEYLITRGHRRIAMIMVSDDSPQTSSRWIEHIATSSIERRQGYFDGLRGAGIDPDYSLLGTISPDERTSQKTIAKLLRQGGPTAVDGCNDGAAYRTIEVARQLGLRVPEDLSVIGFDDITQSASFDPPLTTIRQPFRSIGQKEIELLCEVMDGGPVGEAPVLMEVELIERLSTAPR